MKRSTPLLLLVLLVGGCNRAGPAADALDADADARARTAAKTLDDIAAAEQASARALPAIPASPAPEVATPPAQRSIDESPADEPVTAANTLE